MRDLKIGTQLNEILEDNLYNQHGEFRYSKDLHSSIFDSWDKIMKVESKLHPKLSIPKIKKIYYSCTHPDKFLEGLYQNYCDNIYYDDYMKKSIKLLSSYADQDVYETYTNRTQQYDLYGFNYMPAAVYHKYLSNTSKPKNTYPNLFNCIKIK